MTITGTNFTGAISVSFAGIPAVSFTVASATSITAVAPAEAAGTVDITVTTCTGISASTSADHFTYTLAGAPTVTTISPSGGTTGGGTQVTITGTNFTGATGVSFGTFAATSYVVVSAMQITAVAPPQPAGTVDVRVTTYAGTSGTSAGDRFTYIAASAPAVTQVSPASGTTAGGSAVTILGSGFTGASAVNFGGSAAAGFTVLSDGAVVAFTPATLAAGVVDITVTTPTGTSATGSADHFTYNAVPTPMVTGLGTTSGNTGGGTSVTITGTGFLNATDVLFGGLEAASFAINSDSSITAVTPPQFAGAVDVVVAAYGAQSPLSAADQFTYSAAPAPAISGASPATGSGAGGTIVTLSGSGFTGASAVSFSGVPAASFTVLSDVSITAISPPAAAGTYDIVVTTPTGSSAVGSADQFTYVAATAPAVTQVNVTEGSSGGGAVLTVLGTNFSGVTAVNFGAVAATFFTLNADGTITALAPPQAAGTVDVTVTTPSGTSAMSAADQFTYSAANLPAVTIITASSGSTVGGTLITVVGSGFTGASAVNFGGTAATSFTVVSDNALTAVAPSGAAGTVDITVTTPSGTSSTAVADQFIYVAPAGPTVTGLSTTSGSTAGGTVVIVTGSGFTTASSVAFGAYLATSFTIDSDTQLTAVAPPEAAGVVDITVTNGTGTSPASSADEFTYATAAAPVVTAVSLNSGPTTGGNEVLISGSAFTGATSVLFGSSPALAFTITADGSIVATVPPSAAGVVDVTVTTYSSTSATSAADQYTYLVPAPLITYVDPSSGPLAGGTSVTINGADFMEATAVHFGTVAASSFTVVSPTEITVLSPPGSQAGTVDITVTTAGGDSATSSADQFQYTSGGNAPESPPPSAPLLAAPMLSLSDPGAAPPPGGALSPENVPAPPLPGEFWRWVGKHPQLRAVGFDGPAGQADVRDWAFGQLGETSGASANAASHPPATASDRSAALLTAADLHPDLVFALWNSVAFDHLVDGLWTPWL